MGVRAHIQTSGKLDPLRELDEDLFLRFGVSHHSRRVIRRLLGEGEAGTLDKTALRDRLRRRARAAGEGQQQRATGDESPAA